MTIGSGEPLTDAPGLRRRADGFLPGTYFMHAPAPFLLPLLTLPNAIIMPRDNDSMRPTDFAKLTTFQVEQMVIDGDLREECKKLFDGSTSLKDLRASSRLGKHDTPSSATCEELAQYTWSIWGAGAEALALTLWHLASVKRLSGKTIERYRDAAEFAW